MIHNSHGIPGLTMLVAHSVSTYCEYHNANLAIKRVIITLKDPRLETYDHAMPKQYTTCPYFKLSEWRGDWSWTLYGKSGHRAAYSGNDVATKESCEDSIEFFTDNFHRISIAHIIKNQG